VIEDIKRILRGYTTRAFIGDLIGAIAVFATLYLALHTTLIFGG